MVRVVSSRLLAVWLLTAVEAALSEVAVWLLTAVEVADAALLCERADVGVWLLIAVVASSVLSGRLRSSRAALLAVRLLLGVWLLTAVDAADAALQRERADVAVWLAVAVASSGGVSPCGACRQVLMEFGDMSVILVDVDQEHAVRRHALSELLPHGFSL